MTAPNAGPLLWPQIPLPAASETGRTALAARHYIWFLVSACHSCVSAFLFTIGCAAASAAAPPFGCAAPAAGGLLTRRGGRSMPGRECSNGLANGCPKGMGAKGAAKIPGQPKHKLATEPPWCTNWLAVALVVGSTEQGAGPTAAMPVWSFTRGFCRRPLSGS